jgi:hypothetical protein
VNGDGAISSPCAATDQDTSSCYLWVPVTDANNSPGLAHIVTFACMLVSLGGSGLDKWWGTLETNATCPTYPYQPVWSWGDGSSNTIVALTS